MQKRRNNNRRNERHEKKECYFCQNKSNPDYKDTLVLRRYITERGRLLPASRTGTCSKHQRKLSSEIKKSRFMALIHYIESHAL